MHALITQKLKAGILLTGGVQASIIGGEPSLLCAPIPVPTIVAAAVGSHDPTSTWRDGNSVAFAVSLSHSTLPPSTPTVHLLPPPPQSMESREPSCHSQAPSLVDLRRIFLSEVDRNSPRHRRNHLLHMPLPGLSSPRLIPSTAAL